MQKELSYHEIEKAKEKVISVSLGKVQELEIQKEEILKSSVQVGINHNIVLKRLDTLLKEKQRTQEQYDDAVLAENEAYKNQIDSFNLQIKKIIKDIDNINLDPEKKIKEDRKKIIRASSTISSLNENKRKFIICCIFNR